MFVSIVLVQIPLKFLRVARGRSPRAQEAMARALPDVHNKKGRPGAPAHIPHAHTMEALWGPAPYKFVQQPREPLPPQAANLCFCRATEPARQLPTPHQLPRPQPRSTSSRKNQCKCKQSVSDTRSFVNAEGLPNFSHIPHSHRDIESSVLLSMIAAGSQLNEPVQPSPNRSSSASRRVLPAASPTSRRALPSPSPGARMVLSSVSQPASPSSPPPGKRPSSPSARLGSPAPLHTSPGAQRRLALSRRFGQALRPKQKPLIFPWAASELKRQDEEHRSAEQERLVVQEGILTPAVERGPAVRLPWLSIPAAATYAVISAPAVMACLAFASGFGPHAIAVTGVLPLIALLTGVSSGLGLPVNTFAKSSPESPPLLLSEEPMSLTEARCRISLTEALWVHRAWSRPP
jgi:hypothetical protein